MKTARSAWASILLKLEDALLHFVVFTLFARGTSLRIPVRFVYDRILALRIKDLSKPYKALRTFAKRKRALMGYGYTGAFYYLLYFRRVKSKIKRLLRFLGYLYIKRKLILALIIVIKSYFQFMQAFFLNS